MSDTLGIQGFFHVVSENDTNYMLCVKPLHLLRKKEVPTTQIKEACCLSMKNLLLTLIMGNLTMLVNRQIKNSYT